VGSSTGGNMRKKLIVLIAVVMLVMQTGCTLASTEVMLEPVAETAAFGSSSENLASAGDKGDVSFPEEKKEGLSDASGYVSANSQVVVYVCGAVKDPGVYELEAGSRLDDAVKAAGGFDDEADRTYVNLAAVCEDGIKLYIPTEQEIAKLADGDRTIDKLAKVSGSTSGGPEALGGALAAEDNGLININTATKEELTSLPGIGGGYADRIIAYRSEKGAFKSIEDIKKVSGIKDKLFSKIKDKITV